MIKFSCYFSKAMIPCEMVLFGDVFMKILYVFILAIGALEMGEGMNCMTHVDDRHKFGQEASIHQSRMLSSSAELYLKKTKVIAKDGKVNKRQITKANVVAAITEASSRNFWTHLSQRGQAFDSPIDYSMGLLTFLSENIQNSKKEDVAKLRNIAARIVQRYSLGLPSDDVSLDAYKNLGIAEYILNEAGIW